MHLKQKNRKIYQNMQNKILNPESIGHETHFSINKLFLRSITKIMQKHINICPIYN